MAAALSYRDLSLVPVPGTTGIPDFHIGATPVTREFWTDVMGSNPVPHDHPRYPVTGVSWDDVTGPGGFLERLNALGVFRGTAIGLRLVLA
jgi:hypothetical protein